MSTQAPGLDQLTALAVDVLSVDYDWGERTWETEWCVIEPTTPTPVLKDCVPCKGDGEVDPAEPDEGGESETCEPCWGLGKRVDFDASHHFFNDHMGTDREEDIIIDSEECNGDGSTIRDCWIEYGQDIESWTPMMNYYYEVPDLSMHQLQTPGPCRDVECLAFR